MRLDVAPHLQPHRRAHEVSFAATMVLVDAVEVDRRFDLGELSADPSIAASGWGGRNRVWRFDTKAGASR